MSQIFCRLAHQNTGWSHLVTPFVFLAAAAAAAGCESVPEGTLERAHREGFLRVAYSEEPPYSFLDEATGQVRGESPEALRSVLDELGIDDVRWVRLDFGELIPALLTGRVDVVAAGLFRTPEREEQVRFSVPTSCSKAALIVPAGSSLSSIADLSRERNRRLAVLNGSVEQRAAAELEIGEDQIVTVPDLSTGVAAVAGGSADAFAITAPTARRAVGNALNSSLEIREYEPPPDVQPLLAGCSALAFRPSDVAFVDAVDDALAKYVGSERHAEVLQRLGLGRENIPPGGGSL